MYNKLISTSILCALLGASSMVFGMEEELILILRVELNDKGQKKDVRYYDPNGTRITPDRINLIKATENSLQTLIFDTSSKAFIPKEEASTTTTTTMTTSHNTKDCFDRLSKQHKQIIKDTENRILPLINTHGNNQLSSCTLEFIEYKKQPKNNVQPNNSSPTPTNKHVADQTIVNNDPSAVLGQQPADLEAVLGQQPTNPESAKKIQEEIDEMLTGLSGDDSSEEASTPTRFATLKKFAFKAFVVSSAFTALLGLVTFLQHRNPAFTAKYYPSLMTQFTTTQLAPLFASLGKHLSQPMLVIKRFMKA